MELTMGIETFIEPLKYDFMVRALITAILSGVMLSVLGSFTINKNMGFMADAMAHSTLPIIAVGVFFGFSISELGAPAAVVIALFLGFIIKNTDIGEDTSIGIIFSSFFALGFVLISVLDVSINLEDLLFGQILAVSSFDVAVIFALFLIVLSILFIFFKQILFYSFDPIGAEVRNLNVSFLNYLFLIILSLSIVGSLQTVGIVLVLSMLLIPAASAKLVSKTFISSIRISALFGGIASVSGLYLSYYFNLPSGPTMSLVASGLFVFSFIFKKVNAKPKLIST
jgi:ABC-type Mn2+/Zn2+ transport system permease subunit